MSHHQRHTSPGRRRAVRAAGVAALATAVVALGTGPALAATITPTTSAPALAAALAGPGATVTGSSFVSVAGGAANGVVDALTGFPTHGGSFAALTTGDVAAADDPNANVPDAPGAADDQTLDLGGGHVRGDTDQDVSVLKVDLSVPATANCLRFDFQFLSEEYQEYVGTAYNDAFVAELDSSTWTTSGSTISAPGNFAFDPSGNVISVNAAGVTSMTAAHAAGTTYDGATPLLSAAKPVTPGAHSVYFSVFDQGDGVLDSAAFLDNLQVGFVPDPATQCVPGAVLKRFDLTLTPSSGSATTGTTHTVTAHLADADDASAIAAGSILFQTANVTSLSGSGTTDASGEATFGWTSTAVGTDAVSACYDVGSDGTCDASDPVASATVDWTNAAPVADAGGPYTGDEGSATAVGGSATDVNGDPLTYAWTAAAGAGVDPGASCSFADPADPTTTVTCTDDGTWTLTLSADDGTDQGTDTAQLVVGNEAPSVGTVTGGPAGPVQVGTPVGLAAPFTDPGSNDTHSAVWTWDDGSSSPATAAGGSTAGSHTYTTPGVYTPCVTVTDDDGGSDSSCLTAYVVVYDPSAGFVTGGGWISSPPGAYTPDDSSDADLTGRAGFGFVSKYKKGATVPTGSTEFQFHAGGLNFHSASYDWLVVAGSKAVYKGSGTVNGTGGYQFLVSAVDGSPDRFRIKIWNASGVLYDNQAGAADGAAASTALGSGQVVIHG